MQKLTGNLLEIEDAICHYVAANPPVSGWPCWSGSLWAVQVDFQSFELENVVAACTCRQRQNLTQEVSGNATIQYMYGDATIQYVYGNAIIQRVFGKVLTTRRNT